MILVLHCSRNSSTVELTTLYTFIRVKCGTENGLHHMSTLTVMYIYSYRMNAMVNLSLKYRNGYSGCCICVCFAKCNEQIGILTFSFIPIGEMYKFASCGTDVHRHQKQMLTKYPQFISVLYQLCSFCSFSPSCFSLTARHK